MNRKAISALISLAWLFLSASQGQTARTPEMSALATHHGSPSRAKMLIIEAEDLGMAHAIDEASFRALENRWVTSAGILVPAPWFPEVAHWAARYEQADLGVELDLTADWTSCAWRPVADQGSGSSLEDRTGYFPLTEMYVARHAKPQEVAIETRAQIKMALNAGVPVTHLDTHMRVMTITPDLFRAYWSLGQEFNLPILLPNQRIKSSGHSSGTENVFQFGGVAVDLRKTPVDRIFEMMPGTAKQDWLAAYEKSLTGLPPGVYLLSVHLGYDDDELRAMTWDHLNWGAQWRQNDFDVISNPEFQKFLKDQGFVLVGWRELQKIAIGW